jgi:hypothetical protein
MKIKIRKMIKSKIRSRIKIGQCFPVPNLNLNRAPNHLPNLNLHLNLAPFGRRVSPCQMFCDFRY